MKRLIVLAMIGVFVVSGASLVEAQTPAGRSGRTEPQLVDINSASLEELKAIPGIGDTYAQKIIDGRPYRGTAALMLKGIMPQAVYDQIAWRIVAKEGTRAAPEVPRKPITSQRDVAELAAQQHPGEKWGYGNLYTYVSDSVGQLIVIKVPNTVPDGALITVPADSYLRESDRFYKEVRGHVRRGKGPEGLDVFEIVAVRHEASSAVKQTQPFKDRPDGWESIADLERLTHRSVDKRVLLSK